MTTTISLAGNKYTSYIFIRRIHNSDATMPPRRPGATTELMHMNDISTELGRRERKRLQQLDHLADTAWTLFEAEGYEAVTMERIAAEADVAKATLYKHFPAKDKAPIHERRAMGRGKGNNESIIR
jgi:hypothetical protein